MSIATRPGWLVYGKRDAALEAIVGRLHVRYPSERYALLEQVRDGPGFSAGRTGDLLAVGLWPSRGCEVEGFEVKVSRADWLRELKAPQKAESLFGYCDRWWLVVPSAADVLRDGELPATWGCLEAPGKATLRIVTPAPKLDGAAFDRWFLAALLKRALAEPVRRSRLTEAYAAGLRDGEAHVRTTATDVNDFAQHVTRFTRAAERLQRELNYTQTHVERAAESVRASAPHPGRTE